MTPADGAGTGTDSERLGWPKRFLVRLLHVYFALSRGMTLGVRAACFDDAGRIFLVRHTYVPGWHMPGGGVFVIDAKGLAAVRPVRLGPLVDSRWIVEEGLKPGDKVIVEGLQKIAPDMPVQATEKGSEPAKPAAPQAAAPAAFALVVDHSAWLALTLSSALCLTMLIATIGLGPPRNDR